MGDLLKFDHRVAPGDRVRIGDLPTRVEADNGDKEDGKAEFLALRLELAALQERLYAANKHRVLVLVQGMDASGKDGVLRDLFDEVHPEGILVTSFKVPTAPELARDYLWRVHQAVPPTRMIGIFNRSHYEDVLVVRVDGLVPESVWKARYEQINQFEKHLVETGTVLIKLYLHISKKEQRERLEERMRVPEKQWKFAAADVAKHKKFGEYLAAYEDALTHCSTPWAPWYAIPADQNWYRNLAAARIVVGAIRKLDPQFPKPAEDWSGVSFD